MIKFTIPMYFYSYNYYQFISKSPDAVDVALWHAEDAGEAWIRFPWVWCPHAVTVYNVLLHFIRDSDILMHYNILCMM